MTRTEEIFRTTLETLASQGNEQAKHALNLASTPINSMTREQVCSDLANAAFALNEAINCNSTKWTSATDRAIGRAQSYILAAVSKLALS